MADTEREFSRVFNLSFDLFNECCTLVFFNFTVLLSTYYLNRSKGVQDFVWRSQFWLKINWVFIRSHHDHLVWSPFVFLSSTSCQPSTHLILDHLNSTDSNSTLNRALHNSTNFTINFIKPNSTLDLHHLPVTRARPWVSSEREAADTRAARVHLPRPPAPVSATPPNLPSWLQLHLYHPSSQGGNIGWHFVDSNDMALYSLCFSDSHTLVGPECFHLSLWDSSSW